MNESKENQKEEPIIEIIPTLVPCFLCGNGIEIRKTQKGNKPYLICETCGIQIFIRGKRGIKLFEKYSATLNQKEVIFKNNIPELNSLLNRLGELKTKKSELEVKGLLDLFPADNSRELAITALEKEIEKLIQELKRLNLK